MKNWLLIINSESGQEYISLHESEPTQKYIDAYIEGVVRIEYGEDYSDRYEEDEINRPWVAKLVELKVISRN